jgi:multicomponent K+:H+ antiporter subunit F
MSIAVLLDMTVTGALGATCVALLLCLWRLVSGPTVTDRILALDTLSVTAIAALMLWGMQLDSTVHFEAALVIAMLGFGSTVVLSKFVLRRDIVS